MLRASGTKPVQRGSNLPTDFLNLFKGGAVGSDEPLFVNMHLCKDAHQGSDSLRREVTNDQNDRTLVE
jgi:hypothetical protein